MGATRRRLASALSLFAALAIFAPPVLAQVWGSYTNDRYGTSAAVPPGFVMQAPPGNNDGRTFLAGDGAVLRIFAEANAFDDAPAAYIDRRLSYGGIDTIAYRAAKQGWAVVSGRTGAKIIYEKYLFKDDVIHHMTIEYPAARRAAYDSIVARLAASLRAP